MMPIGRVTKLLASGFALTLCMGLGACKKEGMGVESVEPPFGSIAGNDDVVLTGYGFQPGLTVQFQKRAAKKVVIESDTKIRVKTPAGLEGQVDVIVTDQTGKTYVLKNGFTYRKETS